MKKLYIFLVTVFVTNLGFSQEDIWSKLFLERLDFSLAIPKNVVFTDDLKIIFPVVEDGNSLRIYQLNENGDIIRILNTEESATSISEIIKVSESEFALIFNVEPLGVTPLYKVIYFNEVLQITHEASLTLPIISNFVDLIRFFKVANQLFLTFNDNGTYYLMRLDGNNELQIVYTSTNNVFNDNITLLSTGNILIDFSTGQNHTLKCVNPDNGNLVWEQNYSNANELDLDYIKTTDNDDNIYLGRLIRNFVNGEIFDVVELLKIDGNDGGIILNVIENPANNCVLKFEDLKYNQITQEICFSYSNCSDPGGIVLKSFSNSLEPLNTINVEASPDGFFASIVKSAQILIRNDGRVVFTYRNYKNNEELDNIYFLSLTSDFNPIYTGELNIPPKNGIELFVDIQLFGDEKAVVIGDVPHRDPSISWERIQFFISMVGLDNVLTIKEQALDNIILSPNPAKDNLTIISTDSFDRFQVFDVSGKRIECQQNSNTIDISRLKSGVYFLLMKTNSSNTVTKKFIKL